MSDPDLLRRIRNDLPMPVTIAALGADGPPAKVSAGHYRFLCPRCGDMHAAVNPRNNLAHCFGCHQNLNNIDLLMTLGRGTAGLKGTGTFNIDIRPLFG